MYTKYIMNKHEKFELYDLRVEISSVKKGMEDICNHHLGDYFELRGENITIPPGKSFSIYALAAVLPLLPAKQRVLDRYDWMDSDNEVMCPDPLSEAKMKITRIGKTTFNRGDTTGTVL